MRELGFLEPKAHILTVCAQSWVQAYGLATSRLSLTSLPRKLTGMPLSCSRTQSRSSPLGGDTHAPLDPPASCFLG